MKFSFLQTNTLDAIKRLLDSGLRKLTFRDNFFASVREVTISANTEIQVTHDLNIVPKYYILGSQDLSGSIVRGEQTWTVNSISVKNDSNNNINTTLIIMG